MDEDDDTQKKDPSDAPNDSDEDSDISPRSSAPRLYDFSDDLNISPVTDETDDDSVAAAPVPDKNAPPIRFGWQTPIKTAPAVPPVPTVPLAPSAATKPTIPVAPTPIPKAVPQAVSQSIPRPAPQSVPRPVPKPALSTPAPVTPVKPVVSTVPTTSNKPIVPQAPTSQPVPAKPSLPTPPVTPIKPTLSAPTIAPTSPVAPAPINKAAEFLNKTAPITPSVPPKPPAPTAAQKEAPAAPTGPTEKTSYREPIENAKEWPFAVGQTIPDQPHMGQMAPKAKPDQTVPVPPKTQPRNAPVKTIRSDSSADEPKESEKPATNLQRDVLSILPNLHKDKAGEIKTPTQPMSMPGSQGSPRSPVQAEEGALKSLRTYEGDVAEVMSHRKTSSASMAIAENKKATGEERIFTRPTSKDETTKASSSFVGKLFFTLLSVALIAGGGIGGYYMYTHSLFFQTQQPTTPVAQPTESLVPSDFQSLVGMNRLDSESVLSRIEAETSKAQNPDTIKEIIPIDMTAAQPIRMTTTIMENALKLPIPNILLRTLNPAWMLGVYTEADSSEHPFVVVTTDFFQNALSGMLQWEATMPVDLAPYVITASSTPMNGHFKDEIVQNKDVRAYVASTGQTLFLYSFIDNSTLVFAQDEATLNEIVTRLENRVFVR